MLGQRKLLDGVALVSSEQDRAARDAQGRLAVRFQSGQTGFLDAQDPLSAHWAGLIGEQAAAGQPVYAEIDEESGAITNVLLPRVFTVRQLETDARGNLRVHLHQSSAVLGVLQSAPNFAALRDSLQAALADGSERLITSTRDYLEIIDVREPAGGAGAAAGPSAEALPDPPVSPARLDQIFGDMSAESCAPCNPSASCIPFLYPDDGCWIRAHLMAYKMRDYAPPEDPEKLYIQGSLDPFAPNHPDCRLPWGWGWHIAPTLMVALPGGDEKRVVDPSLSPAPVSVAEWTALNNASSPPTLTPLAWTVYNPVLNDTASAAQAQSDMQYYRGELRTRCLQFGPPPYGCTRGCFFIVDRSTFSDDEVEAMLLAGSPAVVQSAFYVVVDGFSPYDLGFTAATMQHTPALTPPPPAGMAITPVRLAFEYPAHLNRRQRLTWVYDVSFTDTGAFTAPVVAVPLQASMGTVSASASLYLIQQPNPYEVDGEVCWLSTDLRVFQLKQGESKFGALLAADPSAFISAVISNLNAGSAGGQTFEADLSLDQQTSRLELSGTVGGVPVYNFALAKVRYRSLLASAADVRVFFRLFPVATTSLEYDQGTAYRRHTAGATVVPLLGIRNNDIASIPCFAAPRINSAAASLATQTDPANVQTIPPDAGGAEVARYFGCWLDINQVQPQFPLHPAPPDGPYPSGRLSIQDLIRNEHQCLVAEIAFTPAPPQNGATPSTSDKLAQRNLAIVASANPGLVFSRRIAQTFEVRPSAGKPEHDELMFDWGNVPAGSVATLYLPGLASAEVMRLAAQKYRSHRLLRIDGQTLKFETGGITYLPLPFTDASLAGLLTVDLPEGVEKGQVFKVVVRQVTGEQQAATRARAEAVIVGPGRREPRHIVGAFQLTIPVRSKAEILPGQQRLLSNLRWIERAIPAGDRWAPVFGKYVAQVAARVDALGGDASQVAPSSSGEWEAARQRCRLLMLAAAVLLALLLLVVGLAPGAGAGLGGALLAALLGGAVRLWRASCRPALCQILLAVLAGAGAAALTLGLALLLGADGPRLLAVFLAGTGLAAAAGVAGWLKGCWRPLLS